MAQGTWNFEWTVGELDPETLLEVNKKCDFGGYEINVRSMEISPFFWKIYLDYQDAMKVYEDEEIALSTMVLIAEWIFMQEPILML